MKLHLPLLLRKALVAACFAIAPTCTVASAADAYYEVRYANKPSVEVNTSVLPPLPGNFISLVASGVSVSGSLNGESASFLRGTISNSNLTLSSVDIYETTISDLTCNAPELKIKGDEDRWSRVSNLTLNRVNDATISHVIINLGFNAKGSGASGSDLELRDSYVIGNVSVQNIDFVSFRDCNFSQGIEGSILGGSNLHIYSTDENSGTGSFFVVGENGFTISKVRDESGIGGVAVATYGTKHRSVIECNGNLTFSNNTKVSLSCHDMVGGSCTINWKSGNLVFDGNDEVILSGNSFASDMPELGYPCSIVSDFSVAALSSNPTERPTLYLNTKADSASRITFGNVINVASSVSLNKYTDNQGTRQGTGTIVFSAEEIYYGMSGSGVSEALQAAAKVSKIKGDVNLYSGSLQIVDGACLDISGTVNSAPTSIDAESKYRSDGLLKIHPGSTLSVSSSSVGLFYPTSSLKTNILDLSGSNASNTSLEIVCNSHPSLFVPVIEVNERLIISDNSALSIDMSSTSTWDMMPLIKLNGEIEYNQNLGEYDDSVRETTGIDRFFTYSEILPWTKNDAFFDLKLGMFDWRNQEDIELTWINDILYLRDIENTLEWMLAGFNPLSGKNSYNKDYIMYDVDKPLVNNSNEKKHSNACWLYTSANIISYFLSKYGPLTGKELPDVNVVKDLLVNQYQTQINENNGGKGTDVLCDWIEGSDMFQSIVISKKRQKFFTEKENTWAKKFKWKVTELPLLPATSYQELCSAIEIVRVHNDAPMYMRIKQEEFTVGPDEYGPEKVTYHAVTCWGYRHYRSILVDPSDMDNEDDNLLVFYYTDSDTEPHEIGKPYSEMWVKRTKKGWQVIQMNGKKCDSGAFVEGLWCITDSKDALPYLRQSQVALIQHQSTAVPLTYAGTVQNSQWRSSNRNDSNKRELGSGNVPIETTDYIWRKDAYYAWSYAYFYDDSEDVNGASGCGFAESETSFQFIDEVDGVVIPRENKRITLADELGVQDVTVEGTDFIFSGAGTLKARTLTVSGGLTLEENVRVEDTPVVLQGGSMNVASQDNQIRVSGGSISLSEGGALNCAEIEYTGGSYSLKGCGVNSIVSSDGSGILSALVDFSGATVRFAQIKSLSTDTTLNQLLYNSVNATGGLDKYKFDYAIEGANIVANAAELENAQVALHSSALKIEGAGNAGVTIGSYFANANESHSQIVLSEQGKSKVESATATLTTQRNEKTYISQGTELDVAGLSVVTGSSMCNDGDIAGHGNQTQITVQPGAELSGRGHFGVTQILEQGKLQVGDGSGAPVYDALQAQSGSVLTFYVDGTETANGTLHGWGSGTHSLLTVNGDLSIANGTIVQVGCSLDFLNSVATGEVQTLTMIQLSDAPSADTLQALQSGTVLMWDEMGAISGLSNVGADIHDVLWSVGADNTLQLSFIVSSRPEYSLLWSSAGASQTWDTSSRNWQDAAGNQVAYEVGKSVLFYDGGTVEIIGEHAPEKLIVSTPEDLQFEGSGSIGGESELIKEGSGELTINTDNTYSGGTSIYGGRLVAAHAGALGTSGVLISGGELDIAADRIDNYISSEGDSKLTVENGHTLVLTHSILNDGTLTLKGTLDVSALVGEIEASEGGRLDINGNVGDNGFASSTEISVAVVDGGTIVDDGVEILAHGMVLTLGADGIASNGGGTNYAEYLVTTGHEVSASAVHAASKGALRQITLNDGVLNADASVKVEATGGEINLSAGTLSGSISGTALNVSDGALTAQLSGSNTLTASDWAMQQSIANTGNLTLTGTLDASSLQKQLTGVDVRVDENGNAGGQSGFLRTGDFTVTVAGGTVDSTGATVRYGSQTLTMNGGSGSGLGEVQLGTYLLTGNDTATVSLIQSKAGNALQKIEMHGGTLNVDASTDTLAATAGQVNLSAGTLGGSLSGSASVVVSGTATITGSNSYSGGTSLTNASLTITDAKALGTGHITTSGNSSLIVDGVTLELSSTISNSGSLCLNGNFDASALTKVSGAASYVDVEGKVTSAGSGFAHDGDFTVTIAAGTVDSSAAQVMYKGTALSMEGGVGTGAGVTNFTTYRILGDHEVNASAIKAASKDALEQITLSGGELNADASTKVVATGGTINLSAGTLSGNISGTALNVSGGTLTAQLSGSNTLAASNWALQQSIANTGKLTLTGMLDASALQKQLTGVNVRVDENGTAGGQSGFLRTGDFTVTVAGGTVDSTGATVSYGGQTLSMNGGTGSGLGEVQLGTYLLTGNDIATVSKIQAKAGSALQKIEMQGGTLNVDASTDALVATAGQVNLSAGTLGGSLSGSASVVVSGTATITGSNSYSGGTSLTNASLTITDAKALGTGSITTSGNSSLIVDGVTLELSSTISNSGSLCLNGNFDASALDRVSSEDSYVDAVGNVTMDGSGFTRSGDFTVTIATGTVDSSAAKVMYMGAELSMKDGVGSGTALTDFTVYRILGGHEVSASAVKAASNGALRQITLSGGELNADASTKVVATGGTINLSTGTLSGSISGTALNVSGGTLTAQLSGSNTLNANNWAMQQSIANTGKLTLTGMLDASALQKQLTGVNVRVDENGTAGGQSGFLRTGDFTVTVAGGTVDSTGATVRYGSQTLTMNGGMGSGLGEVQLGTYLLTGNDTATVSLIQSKAGNALQKIEMQGGTLNVDASTDTLAATAGQVNLSAGTLGGSLSGSASVVVSGTATITGSNSYSGGTSLTNASLTITDAKALGTGSITTSGNSSLIVDGVALELGKSITNTGSLSLLGCIDASNLELVKIDEGRLSLEGKEVSLSESGFTRAAAYNVTLVNGGTVVNEGVVILHDKYLTRSRLELGNDGVARAGGGVDYRDYFLTGDDSVRVSDIAAVSSRNHEELARVTMNSGTLTMDQSMDVLASGGNIRITKDVVLSGSINQTAVIAAEGDYNAEITARLMGDSTLVVNGGNITVSGSNSYTGGTTINGGCLKAGHRAAFGAGSVTVNDATLDLNNFAMANKVLLNGNSTLVHAAGLSNLVLGRGAMVNFCEAYTLDRGETLAVSDAGAVYTGALTLGGGTLELSGLLTVNGDVKFASGATTTLDISGWKGLDDGDVLADFGSSNSGYADGCLSLDGIAGDWELAFDAATGVLTLVAVKDAPMPEPEFAPELNRNQQIAYDTMKDIMGEGKPDGLLGQLGKEVTDTRDETMLKELLDALGGAEYATLMSSQQDATRGHMRRLRGSMGSGHALAGTKTRAYIEAYTNRSDVDGDTSGRGYEMTENGGQFALEFLGVEKVNGGFAVASGRTKLQPDGGLSQKSSNTYVDAFLVHRDGGYTGKTSLGVGVHSYDLERQVMGNAVSAQTDGSSVNFMHESAYEVAVDEVNSVQFFGALESSMGKLGAFHEKGAGTASLQVESQDAWMTTLSAGARYHYRFAVLEAAPAATLSLQAGLEYKLGDTESEVEMNFSGAGSHSFRQSGSKRDSFGYNVGASLHMPVSARAAIYASGDAVLRGDSREVNANVGVQLAF